MRAPLCALSLLAALGGCASGSVSVDCDGGCRTPDAAPGPEAAAQVDAAPTPDGTPPSCPDPAACAAGSRCAIVSCGTVDFTCGEDGGVFAWTTAVASCTDNDTCTTGDHCEAGACVGTAVTCTTPPGPTCVAADTLRTYAATGHCNSSTGQCVYVPTDLHCPANDCTGTTCGGDPCAGVTCTTPPDACHQATGTCSGGACSYPAKVCTTPPDLCHEATGTCSGGACSYPAKSLDCTRTSATGGACQPSTGQCGGWSCLAGHANCDSSWDNGCETPTTTTGNCGGCGAGCTVGAHATADCSSGTCKAACQSPWADCDGDPSNGCEIPAGVNDTCDTSGLNASGCGTAYCGTSSATSVANFTTWYCSFCSGCHEFSDGSAWCITPAIGGVGQWSGDRDPPGECGSYADKVCTP